MTLSYIIPTLNKLPYLKEALAELLLHKKEDEEIIIIDGGSTDGTPEYLQELFARGDIQQFVSEPAKGLGHQINKGLLMAKGDLIKNLNDDDVYYYDEMQKCKTFMLEHPEIDALGTNGIGHDGAEYRREEDFLTWKHTPYHPFMIAELGLMLRRSSIPLFGIADPTFIFWDGEFTIRLTAGKARLAWYTGIAWKHTFNPSSISLTKAEIWGKESARLARMYPIYSSWKHHVPKPIRDFLRFLVPKKRVGVQESEALTSPTFLF